MNVLLSWTAIVKKKVISAQRFWTKYLCICFKALTQTLQISSKITTSLETLQFATMDCAVVSACAVVVAFTVTASSAVAIAVVVTD
ncbi:hypothetical protein M0804_005211 [Polistes exclamans]|nr:hypothetical protein M0804_005211 [Polistes exclamans]